MQDQTYHAPLVGDDVYGKVSISNEIRPFCSARRLRKNVHADDKFYHRAKNGVYDPLSYYHVVDALLKLAPDEEFRTSNVVAFLADKKPQMIWDRTTVGRILADICETLNDLDGGNQTPIIANKRWNGMNYEVSRHPGRRLSLHRLLDDLWAMSKEVIDEEGRGQFRKRTESPLLTAPSTAAIAVIDVEV